MHTVIKSTVWTIYEAIMLTSSPGFFNVTMDSLAVAGTGLHGHFCRGGCFAIIDSGTRYELSVYELDQYKVLI